MSGQRSHMPTGPAPSDPALLSPPELFETWEPGRRGEILAAAFSVFARNGYSGGSMREIAERVGVSEPALYRHFSGKDAIFLELLRVVGDRVRDEAFALIDGLHPETLRDQIVTAFADRRRVAVRFYGPLFRTVTGAVSRNPEFLLEYRTRVVRPIQQRLSDKAAELDVAFDLRDADQTRDARVRVLLALIVGYLVSSFVIGDEPEEAVADGVLSVMGWQDTPRRPRARRQSSQT